MRVPGGLRVSLDELAQIIAAWLLVLLMGKAVEEGSLGGAWNALTGQ